MSQLAPDRWCASISLGVHGKWPPLLRDGAGQGAVDGFSAQSASRHRRARGHSCVQGLRKRRNQLRRAGLRFREVLILLYWILLVFLAESTVLKIFSCIIRFTV